MWGFGPELTDLPSRARLVRRVAFGLLICVFVVAAICGVLIGIAETGHHSLAVPIWLGAGDLAVGAGAGAVFGWTNKQSKVWRRWRDGG